VGFAEALAADTVKVGPACGIATAIEAQEGDDLAALLAALTNPCITAASISRALTASGHKVAGSTVRRHRAGECSCGTS
jgi:hypothetical protein